MGIFLLCSTSCRSVKTFEIFVSQVARPSPYVQGYRIFYRTIGSSWMVQDVEATSDYSSVLANLQSNTEYEVKMRPYFNELQGHDSITLLMRTPEEGKETRLFSLFNFKKLVFIYNCS